MMGYRTSKKTKFQLPFYAMIHPTYAFDDMKYNHKESMRMSFVSFFLFAMLAVVEQQFTGIQHIMRDIDKVNVFKTFLLYGAIVFLFVISNWAFCELVDGKAKLKHIWITTNYALLPYSLCGYARVILSNILVQDEAVFLDAITVVGVFWSLVVLISAYMTFHEFEISKTILSLAITVIGMLLIVFLLFLMYTLVQQMVETIATVINEIIFRNRLN